MQKRKGNGASVDDVVIHLLHRVSQRADEIFAEAVGEAGLTARQFAVLLSVARSDDPSHGLKAIYRLTEAGIDLLPVLATLGAWGSKYRKADEDLARIAKELAAGGEPALARMEEKLRAEHLG